MRRRAAPPRPGHTPRRSPCPRLGCRCGTERQQRRVQPATGRRCGAERRSQRARQCCGQFGRAVRPGHARVPDGPGGRGSTGVALRSCGRRLSSVDPVQIRRDALREGWSQGGEREPVQDPDGRVVGLQHLPEHGGADIRELDAEHRHVVADQRAHGGPRRNAVSSISNPPPRSPSTAPDRVRTRLKAGPSSRSARLTGAGRYQNWWGSASSVNTVILSASSGAMLSCGIRWPPRSAPCDSAGCRE